MSIGKKHLPILALGLAATVCAGFATAGQKANAGPLSCEIVTRASGGMTSIEGVAHADRALAGSYQLRITGPGANISQGGDFDASPGRAATLGSDTLGGNGGSYDEKLEVTAGGKTTSCTERVGKWL